MAAQRPTIHTGNTMFYNPGVLDVDESRFGGLIWHKNLPSIFPELLSYTGQTWCYMKPHNFGDPDGDALNPQFTDAGTTPGLNNSIRFGDPDFVANWRDGVYVATDPVESFLTLDGTVMGFYDSDNDRIVDIGRADVRAAIYDRFNWWWEANDTQVGDYPYEVGAGVASSAGIFLDNINSDHGGTGGGSDQYPGVGNPDWMNANIRNYQGWRQEVCDPHNSKLFGNIQGSNLANWKKHVDVKRIDDPSKFVWDAVMIEFYAVKNNREHFTEADWLKTQQKAQHILGNGQDAWLVSFGFTDLAITEDAQSASYKHMMFCYASALLIWTPNVYFRYNESYANGYTPPIAEQFQYLGQPTSVMTESAGTYTRMFQHGEVRVTPGANTPNSTTTEDASWAIEFQDVIRINAGGAEVAATDGGSAWQEDSAATPHSTYTPGGTPFAGTDTPASYDAAIPPHVPLALYNTFRRDNSTTANDNYTINGLTPGTYVLRMGFMEHDETKTTINQRVYDVRINGVEVFPNVDHWANVGGHSIAYCLTGEFTISGTSAVLTFFHDVHTSVWDWFEISEKLEDAVAPMVTQPNEFDHNVGDAIYVQIMSPNATSFSATGLPPGLSINTDTGLITGTIAISEYTVPWTDTEVTATNADGSTEINFRWYIRTGGIIANVNIGQTSDVTVGDDTWEEDSAFLTGSGSTANSVPAGDITIYHESVPPRMRDPDIWRFNRFDISNAVADQMHFTVTCADQNPKLVGLGFAEITTKAIGERVFNLHINAGDTSADSNIVQTAFDPTDEAGGNYIPIMKWFVATPNSSNQIVVTVSENPHTTILNAIQVLDIAVAANESPVITPVDTQNDNAGVAITPLQIVATDPEEDTLTYEAAGLPTGLSIHEDTGIISGTIAPAQSDYQANVTVTVTDTADNTDEIEFDWNVANSAPVFDNPGTVNGTEGVEVEIDLNDHVSDPLDQALTISNVNALPSGASLTNGVFTWTPSEGQTGAFSFTARVTNEDTLTADRLIAFSIDGNTPVIDEPGSELQQFTVGADTSFDLDDLLSFEGTAGGSWSTVSGTHPSGISRTGSTVTVQPDTEESQEVVYRFTNGAGLSDTVTFNYVVTAAPEPVEYNVLEGSIITEVVVMSGMDLTGFRAFKSVTKNVSTAQNMNTFGFSAPDLAGMEAARITTRSEAINYLETGDAPDATSGHDIPAGAERWVFGSENIANLIVVSQQNTARVTVTVYARG